MKETIKNALVLPGGGARGAYQVGVLKGVCELLDTSSNPFPVICGTSAGAINTAVLASHAHEFTTGVDRLDMFWSSMFCARIYKTDGWSVFRSGLHWLSALGLGGLIKSPRSLLDNQPLREFLTRELRLQGIDQAIQEGALQGVSITASAYTTANAVSFYQAQDHIQDWQRSRRRGMRTQLNVSHLLASAALPLIFPAEDIGNQYYGDGGMRMVAPLSPAIHLGAQRLLIIGTRDGTPDPEPVTQADYPSLGQIGGYLLDTIFMDTLEADLARLKRINQTLELIPEEQWEQTQLNTIEALVIRPSKDLRKVTQEHMKAIPRAVRMLLRSLGGWGKDWRMASYLLFEAAYCQELISLGYRDAMDKQEEIIDFFAQS